MPSMLEKTPKYLRVFQFLAIVRSWGSFDKGDNSKGRRCKEGRGMANSDTPFGGMRSFKSSGPDTYAHSLTVAALRGAACLQELNASVKAAEAERTAAQQGMHELQLQMREMEARHKSERQILAPENASVLNKILSMEDKGGGKTLPSSPTHGRGGGICSSRFSSVFLSSGKL